MLLVVKKPSLMDDHKVYVWDTDDMVVEGMDALSLANFILSLHLNISNAYVGVKEEIVTCRFFRRELVMLGCGDIWYGDYVYNDFSKRMFKLFPGSDVIFVSDTYYSFELYAGRDYKAVFLFKPTVGMNSNVCGSEGVPITREAFMKQVALGGDFGVFTGS